MESYLIILDPGHGIETPGKRSPIWADGSQLFEYEFNFDIANRIRVALEGKVFFTFTREDEHEVTLSKRVTFANSISDSFDRVLYLSIHANLGKGSGWEVYTSEGQTESDDYATIFFNEMQSEFPDMNFRKDVADGDVDKESQFYVLRNTKMPAVLTENFFMDTLDPDCKLIMSEEGRQKIANAHVRAINNIIEIWQKQV